MSFHRIVINVEANSELEAQQKVDRMIAIAAKYGKVSGIEKVLGGILGVGLIVCLEKIKADALKPKPVIPSENTLETGKQLERAYSKAWLAFHCWKNKYPYLAKQLDKLQKR